MLISDAYCFDLSILWAMRKALNVYRLLTVFVGPEVTLCKQQEVRLLLLTIQLLIKIALDASSDWELPVKMQISAAVKLTYLRVEELSSGGKHQGYNCF